MLSLDSGKFRRQFRERVFNPLPIFIKTNRKLFQKTRAEYICYLIASTLKSVEKTVTKCYNYKNKGQIYYSVGVDYYERCREIY